MSIINSTLRRCSSKALGWVYLVLCMAGIQFSAVAQIDTLNATYNITDKSPTTWTLEVTCPMNGESYVNDHNQFVLQPPPGFLPFDLSVTNNGGGLVVFIGQAVGNIGYNSYFYILDVYTLTGLPAGVTTPLPAISGPAIIAGFTFDTSVTVVRSTPNIDSPITVTVTFSNVPTALIDSAIATISALDPALFDSSGHQNAVQNLLDQALSDLSSGKVAQGKSKLLDAISHTDGCPLRGHPDTNGPGKDWITDCAAQADLYAQLTAIYSALQ